MAEMKYFCGWYILHATPTNCNVVFLGYFLHVFVLRCCVFGCFIHVLVSIILAVCVLMCVSLVTPIYGDRICISPISLLVALCASNHIFENEVVKFHIMLLPGGIWIL